MGNRGNKSHIHRAMKKKDPGDFDLDEKSRLMRILNHYFKLHPLTDEVLFFFKSDGRLVPGTPQYMTKEEMRKIYFIHKPDLLIKNFDDYLIAVEIDGPVHWQNSKAARRTNERNEHYEMGGVKLMWFTKDEVLKGDTLTLIGKISEILRMAPIVLE